MLDLHPFGPGRGKLNPVRTALCAALVVIATGCGAAPAADTTGGVPPDSVAEARAVEQVMVAFYDAMHRWDYAALEAAFTPDFDLIENAELLDTSRFFEFIRPLREQGVVMTYQLTDFNTAVHGPVAWTRYRLHGIRTVGDRRMRIEWLESAVFEKDAEGWKIDRVHSSVVRREEMPPAEGTDNR